MTDPIKFKSTGPDGFLSTKEDLPTAELLHGNPRGAEHTYFASAQGKMRSGIWHSTPYCERYDSYPADEFMYVIEGSVTLVNDNGRFHFKAGDAFMLPRGFSGTWEQEEYMLKYFVILENE
ncbi:MAG: cupin domain-containing protein [Pseudomonadota bacterium]